MKFKFWLRVSCTAAVLTLAMPAMAAQKAANTGPKYDVANEVKIKGVVQEVREVPGEFEGIHLLVKTDTGTVLVHVAPSDFLKEVDTAFKVGDEVQVVGAKAPDAPDEVLAREITVGANTTTLRDNKGIPVWAGWNPAKR